MGESMVFDEFMDYRITYRDRELAFYGTIKAMVGVVLGMCLYKLIF